MVAVEAYVPNRGDVVWISLHPQMGREQAGRRPALVLSPASYNAKVGLAIFCPITSRVKGYPFEVAIRGIEVRGVVLADQIRSLDWRARQVAFLERAPDGAIANVLAMVSALLA